MADRETSAPIDFQIFGTAFAVVLAVIAFLFFAGERAAAAIQLAFDFSTNQLGALYIWFALFCLGKNPIPKPVAEPVQRTLNSVDIRQIGTDSQDHREKADRIRPKPATAKSPATAPSIQ